MSLNRLFASVSEAEQSPLKGGQSLATLTVTLEDMHNALKLVRPSSLREVLVDVPKVYWHDIGGQEDTKQKLKEAVEWPLKVLWCCLTLVYCIAS